MTKQEKIEMLCNKIIENQFYPLQMRIFAQTILDFLNEKE